MGGNVGDGHIAKLGQAFGIGKGYAGNAGTVAPGVDAQNKLSGLGIVIIFLVKG